MATAVAVRRTPYEQRRDLVAEVVGSHTVVDHEAALGPATAVLQAVDHFPDTIH